MSLCFGSSMHESGVWVVVSRLKLMNPFDYGALCCLAF